MTYSVTYMLNEIDEMFFNLSIDFVEVENSIKEDISSTISEYTYALHVYFNDRFYYSTSDVLIFENNWVSIIDMYSDIKKWYVLEGKVLLNIFNDVKYPEDLDEEEALIYFEENKKIGRELWKSVDTYFKTNNNNWIEDIVPCSQ